MNKKRKFQSGGSNKGVLKGTGNVINRQIPVTLNTGEQIFVDTVDGKYLNPDTIYNVGDSVYVNKGFLENKATTFKNKKPTIVKKKQSGGQVLVEDEELFKGTDGNIYEVDSFSHDDEFIEDEFGNVIPATTGGQLVDAQSVVSASYDQVKDGSRKSTAKEKALKFSPKESNSLMKNNGLNWFKTKKSLSPAELIKEAVEQTDNYSRRFQKDYADDQYGKNSQRLNEQQIAQLPNEEDLYDLIFQEQESKKINSGLFEKEMKAQYGGSTYSQKPILNGRPLNSDEIRNLSKKDKANLYINDQYPEINKVNYSKEILRSNANPLTNVINISESNTKDINEEVVAELSHIEQYRKYASIPVALRTAYERGTLGDNKRYETPGTVEYEAHELLEPEVTKKYNDFMKSRLLFGPNNRNRVLKNRLSKKQYGGVQTDSRGVHAVGKNPVVVPSNRISMSDVDFPINAFNADNGEYLATMNPDEEYLFNDVNNVLEVPVAQEGIDYTENIPEPYVVQQGDWISKIAEKYGLQVADILKANPQITNANQIVPGQEINIPELTIRAQRPAQPVDVTDQTVVEEIIPEIDASPTEAVIPTINTPTPEVVAPVNSGNVLNNVANTLRGTSLGRINRNVGTFALREMMRANRNIELPYRPEVPNRTFNYNEEDITPYLDEIDSSVNQQLQYVNQNTSQGQAILNNILSRANREKRQITNRVNAQNLQRRGQIDNANTQLLNQYDLMQEQNNANYVDGVQRTLANQDAARIRQGEYLDQMVNNRVREDNAFTMMNVKYNNIKVDPITGEITRERNVFNSPVVSRKFGGKKKY